MCRFSDCGSLAQKSSHKVKNEAEILIEEVKPKAAEKTEQKVEKNEKPADEKLIQTDTQIKSEKKEKITTNTSKAVAAELAKESHDRVMKQRDVGADNNKDTAPE